MPAVILKNMEGVSSTVTDLDLLELLNEINRKIGGGYELEESERELNRLAFMKPIRVKEYTLYWLASCEYQIINTLAGYTCSKNEMGNLLLGIRMGLDK